MGRFYGLTTWVISAPPPGRHACRSRVKGCAMNDDAVHPGAEPQDAPQASTAAQSAPSQQKLRFDTSNIKSTYCNVCNATSTREEVVVNFGVNKTWDLGNKELEVQLEHRIILSPFAAKRLHELLTKLMTEHEQRYGVLR
jgi:hypothetical protein